MRRIFWTTWHRLSRWPANMGSVKNKIGRYGPSPQAKGRTDQTTSMHKPLQFYSTNLKAENLRFHEALLKGQAPDKGLYMPVNIPQILPEEIAEFREKEYWEIAYHVTRRFLAEEISDDELKTIVRDAYDYEVPLEQVYERKYIMRLDRGPTASFKDFAARMMGRLMQHYLKAGNRRLLILTATSGDTGSAVANAFYGLDNIDIVVLFPRDEVTDRQRKQMTTLGKNVKVLALDAKFDNCQALVKQAFADPLLDYLGLSSANSINIGRLVPQIVYYFYANAKLSSAWEQIVFSVPSGNFGDMMGGVLAMKMGLPVKKFIIATNENNEFPNYLISGKYNKIEPSRNCISSAMNVGHPSNLARLVALYGGIMDEKGLLLRAADMEQMRNELWSVSITDEETRKTIGEAWDRWKLLLEPHGSVGWAGLLRYIREQGDQLAANQLCVSLETAHPAKFPDEIQKITGIEPALPPSLQGIDNKPEYLSELPNNYTDFRSWLISNYK
ncbi:MAG: threonine synthase [Bacteroidetes bacterium]|nr:threonine synthase [Bacteroidota bacterium]